MHDLFPYLLAKFHHLPLQGLADTKGLMSSCFFACKISRGGSVLLEPSKELLVRTLTSWCSSAFLLGRGPYFVGLRTAEG
ncbi:UNVERIFIED_CONTAM: hypothetical protein Slati_1390600 [Sesamum latifolium]|uniref:Uncharacterized protein n=1 Tax=Sesamum latifolium TaxID=2727402 RepID=A0AAW2X2U0_9LAMI